MFLRQLDLTTALRPSLNDGETLLFVQDGVGLYEGKFKIPDHQNGHAYLTSHRVCYVDNEEPRKHSVAVDLKEIERTEFYVGFLKSSPKVTIFPKSTRKPIPGVRSPDFRYASSTVVSARGPASSTLSLSQSPVPARDTSATWICTICGLSNPVPPNFDPSTTNRYMPLPPCQACGIKPELKQLIKAAIAAMSSRASGVAPWKDQADGHDPISRTQQADSSPSQCPRCTFQNHPSLTSCEVCGATLPGVIERRLQRSFENSISRPEDSLSRPESPRSSIGSSSIVGDDTIETIKFSFRLGGAQTFLERLKSALVQRKWLLQIAPPLPRQSNTPPQVRSLPNHSTNISSSPSAPSRVVGIAGLEQRGVELRRNNQAVMGTAFEDLEALMTSAKEVIQMAEQFARQANGDTEPDSDTRRLISDSASALGLMTTKDMLGSGSSAEQLYITELSRDLAEFLTDDRKGILRKEGGIMSLVDLWQVFNRTRNGIELISPMDFEKAANTWDSLSLPVRLRRFKSGLLVVQERSRTDERTITSLLSWLRNPQHRSPLGNQNALMDTAFGHGVTAQETAERFGWSVGVAAEELEMAEEVGALCRDQCLDGTRFWENYFTGLSAQAVG